jgi:hypothetical protein
MHDYPPPILDMTPDGAFRAAPARLGWGMRVFLVALGVSVVTGLIAVVVLLLYVAVLLIPIALGLAAFAYLSDRWRAWRAGAGSVGGERGGFGA